jgi:hypothetical protein
MLSILPARLAGDDRRKLTGTACLFLGCVRCVSLSVFRSALMTPPRGGFTQAAVAVCSAFHSSIVQVRLRGEDALRRVADRRKPWVSLLSRYLCCHALTRPRRSCRCVSCGSISLLARVVKRLCAFWAFPSRSTASVPNALLPGRLSDFAKRSIAVSVPQKGAKELLTRKRGSGKDLIPEEAT